MPTTSPTGPGQQWRIHAWATATRSPAGVCYDCAAAARSARLGRVPCADGSIPDRRLSDAQTEGRLCVICARQRLDTGPMGAVGYLLADSSKSEGRAALLAHDGCADSTQATGDLTPITITLSRRRAASVGAALHYRATNLTTGAEAGGLARPRLLTAGQLATARHAIDRAVYATAMP